MTLVGHLQHAQNTRHAHGTAADHGLEELHRPAVITEEQFFRGTAGRCFTSIIGRDVAGACIVVEQEGAAADAGGLRFNERQHQLCSHCGVHCAAAPAHDIDGRFRRLGIGHRRHVTSRPCRGDRRQCPAEQRGAGREDDCDVPPRSCSAPFSDHRRGRRWRSWPRRSCQRRPA